VERERSGGVRTEERIGGQPDPSRLALLIGQARAAEGLDRFVLAGKINALLIALRPAGNEAAEAKAILAELDVSALDALVDSEGRSCRKEAVETLLACGFPHALNVAPEDLNHARRATRDEKLKAEARDEEWAEQENPNGIRDGEYKWSWYALYAGAFGQAAGGVFTLPRYFPYALGAIAIGALMAFAAYQGSDTRRRSDLWISYTFLFLSSALGLTCAYLTRQPQLAIGAYMTALVGLGHAHPGRGRGKKF